MEKDLQAIIDEAESLLISVSNRAEWDNAKALILGPNGKLTHLGKGIGQLAKEERPVFGQKLNHAKNEIEKIFKSSFLKIQEKADLDSLGAEIDPSLPPTSNFTGGTHPLTNTRRKIVSIFRKIGFTVAEASETETEWFCLML